MLVKKNNYWPKKFFPKQKQKILEMSSLRNLAVTDSFRKNQEPTNQNQYQIFETIVKAVQPEAKTGDPRGLSAKFNVFMKKNRGALKWFVSIGVVTARRLPSGFSSKKHP